MLQAMVYFLIGPDTEKLKIYKWPPKIQCSTIGRKENLPENREEAGERRVETGTHIGRFPFDLNFRFEFSATSSSEQNSFFQNVQNGDNLARHTQKFLKYFPWSFLSIQLCSRNF